MNKKVLVQIYKEDAVFLKGTFAKALAQKYPNTECPSNSYAYLIKMAIKEAIE